MTKLSNRLATLTVVLALPWLSIGCGSSNQAPPSRPTGFGPGGSFPGGPPGGMMRGGDPKIRQAMNRIGRGPQSLNDLLTKEVKADPLDWDKIQPQAAEYVSLTAPLHEAEPRLGSKESWAKQTTAFAEAAKGLDKAAQAKDAKGVRDVQQRLSQSCAACHREHRGRGPGGFGGPMGFGGPPTRPGQIVPPFLEGRLNLTPDQKKQLDDLQKEVDHKLDKILTAEQQKQFHETQPGFGPGGFGGGRRGPGGPPPASD